LDGVAEFIRLTPTDGRKIDVEHNGADAVVELGLSQLSYQAGKGLLLRYAKKLCHRFLRNIVRQVAGNLQNKHAVVFNGRPAHSFSKERDRDDANDYEDNKNRSEDQKDF